MNIAEFADLFKSYCTNYLYREVPAGPVIPISFSHYDLEDLTTVLRTVKPPAFFLSTPEDDFGGDNADTVSESFEASFMILMKLPNNDITKKGLVITAAKGICDDFIRRMMYDARNGTLLEGLNIPGIKAGVVARTGDSLYGWTVSFNVVQGFDGAIRTSVWEDLN